MFLKILLGENSENGGMATSPRLMPIRYHMLWSRPVAAERASMITGRIPTTMSVLRLMRSNQNAATEIGVSPSDQYSSFSEWFLPGVWASTWKARFDMAPTAVVMIFSEMPGSPVLDEAV